MEQKSQGENYDGLQDDALQLSWHMAIMSSIESMEVR